MDGGYPIAAHSELTVRQNARIVLVDKKIFGRVVAGHPYMAMRMTGFPGNTVEDHSRVIVDGAG